MGFDKQCWKEIVCLWAEMGEREEDNFKKIAPLKLLKGRCRIRVLFSFPLSSISLRVQSVLFSFFLCAYVCAELFK